MNIIQAKGETLYVSRLLYILTKLKAVILFIKRKDVNIV